MIESLANVAPYTYLDLAGAAYIIVIIVAYYKKNKVRTLENMCYSYKQKANNNQMNEEDKDL